MSMHAARLGLSASGKLFVGIVLLLSCRPAPAQTYEGYADALTTGGDGGKEVWVTNLDDSGTGSFRAAVAGLTGRPTIIKFAVGGKVCVRREIRITHSNVTIAGETAPKPGMTLECALSVDRGLGINASDVIVRHLRIRNSPAENLQIWGGNRIIIDHCSLTWAGDGAIDINTGRVTVSRCLIAGNVEGSKAHGNRVSMHHNLFTDNNRRQPRVFAPAGPDFDIRNNYIRNWWNLGTQVVGAGASCNIINNFYGPPAPAETWPAALVNQSAGPFYTAGNLASDPKAIDLNALGTAPKPFEEPAVTTLPAWDVPYNVLLDVGAQPIDAIDQGWLLGKSSGYRPAGWRPPADICKCDCGKPPAWSETANWYVDAVNGDDNHPGSATQPFATVAKAITVARAGQLVLVWTGSYTGQLNFTTYAGTAVAPIRFKRDLAAGAALLTSNSSGAPCVSGTKGYIHLDGFEITGGENGIRLYAAAASGWVIKNCLIHGNTQDGVHLRYGSDNLLYNCLIWNNGSTAKGVNIYGNARNNVVRQCTVYNHRYNVYFTTSASGEVRDSIVSTGLTGVYGRTATVNVVFCDVFGNSSNYQYASPGTGCLSVNPQFVAPAAGDFRLQPSSPCRGAASDGGDMGYRPTRY